MRSFVDDAQFAVRLLWRHPSFTILALLTLALGIGTNTAVFSLIRGVLLKPLPYDAPHRLIWFGGVESRFPNEPAGVSFPDIVDIRSQARTLQAVAAYSFFSEKLVITGRGEPEQVDGNRVSANFFDILGVPPALGRGFRKGEDLRGGPRVAVLSHDFWLRNYAGDSSAVGSVINISSAAYQIVGVMPQQFQFPPRTDIWIPLAVGTQATTMREAHSFLGIARLAPHATTAVAFQELTAIGRRLEQSYPTSNAGFNFLPSTLADKLTGSVRDTLYLLAGITAFLLLISSANIANLLLARATSRRREVAVRNALGAPPAAIVRQLLAESMALSFAGGALGTLAAWWGISLLRAWNPTQLPRASELSIDPASLIFAFFISALTALLFGLAPALQAIRTSQHTDLKDSGTRGSAEVAGRARFRSLLVTAEVALAVVLLAGAGLLLESLRQLLGVHPGFETAGVVTTELTLPIRKFRSLEATADFTERYVERLRSIPGVNAAGATLALPMGSVYSYFEFRVVGDPPHSIPPIAGYTAVTPGYFETMRIPLRAGRLFDARDTREAPKTVVISEPLARQHFPGRDPVGRRLQVLTGGSSAFEGEIIGVVGGVRHDNLAQEPRVEIYLPFVQLPYPIANVVVRSTLDTRGVAAGMKSALAELDRDLPIYRVRRLEDVVLESAVEPRVRGFLTALFAGIALLLASMGIYSVMSYAVSQRTQEIGIRMAIGATPWNVLVLILRQSGRLVLIGLSCGLALTFAVGRVLGSMLYRVSLFDWRVYAIVTTLLLIVALVASSVPAWRATHIDPMRALRQD